MFSVLLLTLTALYASCFALEPVSRSWKNWCGTESCEIQTLFTPSTEEELIHVVQKALRSEKRIKVFGSGHSLSAIALPQESEWAVSLENYKKIREIDFLNHTVTVESGMTLKELNEILYQNGLALENLGSVSDQTVGGVFQTGTHGTGKDHGPLHTQIKNLTIVNGKGELLAVDPALSPLLFRACQCGLGTLGIISTVTLKTVPAHLLQEKTYPAAWPDVLDQMEDLIQKNDHVRIYSFPYINRVGIWIANRTESLDSQDYVPAKDSGFFSRWLDDKKTRSLDDFLELGPNDPAIVAKYNQAFFDADFDAARIRTGRSDQIFTIPCGPFDLCGAVEAAIPIQQAKPFLIEIHELIEKNHFPAHINIEIRFVKGDSALLSHASSEEKNALFCYANIISICPNGKPISYEPFFLAFQQTAEKYQGRLHWGKMGRFDPAFLKQAYPHWETFSEIRKSQDPNGIFLNSFTENLFEPAGDL